MEKPTVTPEERAIGAKVGLENIKVTSKKMGSFWTYPLAGAVGAVISALTLLGDGGVAMEYLVLVPIGFVGGIVLWGVYVQIIKLILGNTRRKLEGELLRSGTAELQENIEVDFVTKLVQINFKYLDQYYQQTQNQADKSFLLAAFAGLSGLVIIGIGISMMYHDMVHPSYVTTAAGVLSEFIAAIFFYLYNRTIAKMSNYHDKLVVTQNASLALKIAEGLDDEKRTEAQLMLIDRLSENINHYLTQGEKQPRQQTTNYQAES